MSNSLPTGGSFFFFFGPGLLVMWKNKNNLWRWLCNQMMCFSGELAMQSLQRLTFSETVIW